MQISERLEINLRNNEALVKNDPLLRYDGNKYRVLTLLNAYDTWMSMDISASEMGVITSEWGGGVYEW